MKGNAGVASVGPRVALASGIAAAVVVVSAACAGGGSGDKAGSEAGGNSVVLTLAAYDERDAMEFAEAVEQLSEGSMRIDVSLRPYGDPDYERHTAEDVLAGRLQLAQVGASVWDTLGVTSFSALVAPFLVDNLALERRVLESPVADRMLAGVERAGLVGVALLPGELSVPWGISRPLVRPRDYEHARFGTRPGRVARATLRALGATVRRFVPGLPSGLDGAEFDAWVIAYERHNRQAGWLASNVVLWPTPQTIVMNTDAFRGLRPAQRSVLRRAGRRALVPVLERIVRDDQRLLELICERGRPTLATASAAELRALRKSVRPVYVALERDPQTRRFIAAIRELRRGTKAPGRTRCTRAPVPAEKAQASPLDGRWQVTWTRDDLREANLSVKGLPRNWSARVVYEFAQGRFRGNSGESGTHDIDGDTVRLIFETGRFVRRGEVYALGWSVYRDSLTFSRVPGSEPLQAITAKSWKRIR
jgi:C4-dicarboxylate-binding protein DctP